MRKVVLHVHEQKKRLPCIGQGIMVRKIGQGKGFGKGGEPVAFQIAAAFSCRAQRTDVGENRTGKRIFPAGRLQHAYIKAGVVADDQAARIFLQQILQSLMGKGEGRTVFDIGRPYAVHSDVGGIKICFRVDEYVFLAKDFARCIA